VHILYEWLHANPTIFSVARPRSPVRSLCQRLFHLSLKMIVRINPCKCVEPLDPSSGAKSSCQRFSKYVRYSSPHFVPEKWRISDKSSCFCLKPVPRLLIRRRGLQCVPHPKFGCHTPSRICSSEHQTATLAISGSNNFRAAF
jgi:hypothetical protein